MTSSSRIVTDGVCVSASNETEENAHSSAPKEERERSTDTYNSLYRAQALLQSFLCVCVFCLRVFRTSSSKHVSATSPPGVVDAILGGRQLLQCERSYTYIYITCGEMMAVLMHTYRIVCEFVRFTISPRRLLLLCLSRPQRLRRRRTNESHYYCCSSS